MTQETGDRELAAQLTKAFRDLDDTLKEHIRGTANTSTSQTIAVNAGGPAVWIAVWIASLCCAVMLTLSMVSRADQIDEKRRVDLANDKLSVILQWAPDLAKKVDQTVADKHKGEGQ